MVTSGQKGHGVCCPRGTCKANELDLRVLSAPLRAAAYEVVRLKERSYFIMNGLKR